LGAFVWLGLGWRGLFAVFAVLAALLVLATARLHRGEGGAEGSPSIRAVLRGLRRPLVVRWLAVLEFADLLLDVLLGFLALYLVNEVGASRTAGGLAVAVWTGAALVGGLVLVGALNRISGLGYLRASAFAALVLYPAFLLIDGVPAKIAVLAVLGLVTAGWYTIPKARLYEALAGQSGAVMSLGSIAGLFRGATPLVVGFAAGRFGLDSALWLLAAAPIALLVLLPRDGRA
jgi:FSR family fosmidomycin resistance protein-like MFS transporter